MQTVAIIQSCKTCIRQGMYCLSCQKFWNLWQIKHCWRCVRCLYQFGEEKNTDKAVFTVTYVEMHVRYVEVCDHSRVFFSLANDSVLINKLCYCLNKWFHIMPVIFYFETLIVSHFTGESNERWLNILKYKLLFLV